MTAFTDFAFRQTKIFGTHGCLEGTSREVEVLNFRTGKRERHLIEGSGEDDPHAGGDAGLVRAFIEALTSGRPDDHLTSPEEPGLTPRDLGRRRSSAQLHRRPPQLTIRLPVATGTDVCLRSLGGHFVSGPFY